jgi:MFS family permease
MTATAAVPGSENGHITGFGTRGYRGYVLISLLLVYTLNFIDRTVITVVAQPIINTFSLSDAQWGLLTGPPFAIFYALMGIPIAMWADRSNRVMIIALCVVIWSLMTVFCGLAASFVWLLLFRVGVAIGEAGCTPPANSIITDYFPPKSRANAIGIYSMGVTLGAVFAQFFGGQLAGLKGETFGG